MVPNMHSSLGLSPAIENNTRALERMGVNFLASRDEEGKRKFPDPAWLADEVSHHLRNLAVQHSQPSKVAPRILVTMGTTRGYIDDVRYVSNYSSGALGSLVVEELHRHGIETDVICGPSPVRPRNFWRMTPVETNSAMAKACQDSLGNGATGAILAASVLDFAPEHKTSGKIRSADHERLSLSMVRQPKIISDIHPSSGVKVGFKLETGLTEEAAVKLAQSHMIKYSLSLMVINDLRDVDQSRHKAWFFEQPRQERGTVQLMGVAETKLDVAKHIARHILSQLSS
jgi:phosphopantothenoylcysteine synthetase/decarboxylase